MCPIVYFDAVRVKTWDEGLVKNKAVYLGGPIALIQNGDEIIADLTTNELNCPALDDPEVRAARLQAWQATVDANGGIHPNCGVADTRLLSRMRRSGVSAVHGGGMHPDRELWIPDERPAEKSGFEPKNRYH